MYKITLYDCNCPSCTSGVAEFYADNINKFQKEWFKLEDDKDRKERFLKSLNGEIVTDYYSDSPELNIVQEDKDAKILRTQSLHFSNHRFALYNAYHCKQTATLYTRDKAIMRKLDTLVADFPDTYKLTEQDKVSKTYSFPKSHISYRKPRAVSTKQRERARQMMIANNKAKGV